MQLPFLDEAELRRRIDMPTAIDAMRTAFRQLSDGTAEIPVRTGVAGGGTLALFMPGWLPGGGALGAKIVTVRPENANQGRPLVHAVIVLIDPATGVPSAVMDATWLTALRTGAGAGLATDLLALPDASVLAVVGAGAQAWTQVEAVRAVRPVREIRIRSRTRASAEAFVERARAEMGNGDAVDWRVEEDPQAHVRGAQVIVTATDAFEPVLPETIDPGTHVNAIGAYTPEMRELPAQLVGAARVFVDQREAARAEAGDLIRAVAEGAFAWDRIAGEIGEVVAGAPGRTSPEEVTVFKSVGSAAQDLAVARLALDRG